MVHQLVAKIKSCKKMRKQDCFHPQRTHSLTDRLINNKLTYITYQ